MEPEETLMARAAGAAAAGAVAVLFVGDPRARTPDRLILSDGTALWGEVRDRGTEFDFRPPGVEEWRTLALEDLKEIRFGTAAGNPAEYRTSLKPARSVGVPVCGVSRAALERLLSRSLESSLKAAEAGNGILRPEAVAARVRVSFTAEKRILRNVVGRLPGADHGRKPGTVVIAARYDTTGEPDASAACALALARVVVEGPRPPRGTLILFYIAGEGGELGRGGLATGKPPLTGVCGWVPVDAANQIPLATCEEALLLYRRLADDPGLAAQPRTDPPSPGSQPGLDPPAPGNPREPTLTAARLARLSRRLDDGAASIAAALTASPDDAELLLERGRIRLASGNFTGAEQDAGKLSRLSQGKDGRAELLRSELAHARGDERESALALNRAVQAGLPEAMILRAWRRDWFGPGQAVFVARDLEAAIRRTPNSTALGALSRGIYAYLNGGSEGARALLTTALERDPSLTLAYYYRAQSRLNDPTDLTGAIRDCDRALALSLDEPDLYFDRGMAHLLLKDFTLAVHDFKEYARREPNTANTANAVYNIACAKALMGNYDEALIYLDRALAAGFHSLDHARTDPDLEGIREDPRFERILSSTESE